jgi:hypothetical protein
VSGYALSQSFGYGLLTQLTVIPGQQNYPGIPAAGAGYDLTLTPYDRWRLVFAHFTLTTDENEADRYVTLDYPDGTSVALVRDGAAVAVEASTDAQAFEGSLNRGVGEWNDASAVFFALCGVWRPGGAHVLISVDGIQAGDQLGDIRLTFDVWQGGGQVPLETDENTAQHV